MSSKYTNVMSNIHVPKKLAKETLEKMELSLREKRIYQKKKFSRKLILSAAAAAAALCLLCTGVYAYTSGWLSEFLGDKAEQYESLSPTLENVRISCGDPDISARIDSTYMIDEMLFYRLHITSSGLGFDLPEDMSRENCHGDFQQTQIGDMNTDYGISPWSEIAGTDGSGGFYMNCTLMSSDGFAPGDRIHLKPRRITFDYRGKDENYQGFNIITNVGFDIYFEIADVPKSEKITVDVGRQAVFDSGDVCCIDNITISPLCAVIRTDIIDSNICLGFAESTEVILENGDHLEIMVMSVSFDDECGEAILLWGDDNGMNPIDPKSVSQIIIGDLVIDCKG
ncbi:MAG: hypothetical protein K2N72_06800 [Oscillospiraceae bacterium]|nr:hypothetical protein [Oscillospiraceae bacterium]